MKRLTRAKFLKVIRWKDWATGKLPVYCIVSFYIILSYSKYSLNFMIDFLFFITFASVSSIYGYLINELGDVKVDKEQGKNNTFENFGSTKATLVVVLLFLSAISLGIRFFEKKYFVPLWIIQLFLATFYSIRPLRFKERGILGIAAASIAQFPLPIMLLFSVFGEFGRWDMLVITSCATIHGLALEIGHQRYDLINDSKSKTATFGVKKGADSMEIIYKKVLLIERISWAIVILMLFVKVPDGLFPFSPILPVGFLFGVLFIKTLIYDFRNSKKKHFFDSYYNWKPEDWDNPYHLMHNYFPNLILPVYLALIITLHYHPFAIVFVGLIFFVKQNFSTVSIRQHFLTILTIFFLKGSRSPTLYSFIKRFQKMISRKSSF